MSEIDPQDIKSQKPISDICLGGQRFSQSLNDPLQDESCTIRFKSDCFKFLLELSLQMKKSLPLDENGIIAKLNLLGIEIALDLKRSPTSTVPFAVRRDVAAAPPKPPNWGGAQVSLKLLFGYVTIFSSADLFTTDLYCTKKLACDIISECNVILSRRI